MKVKDLILELQQIHDQEKEVNFGSNREDEERLGQVNETEFVVYISSY